MPLDAGTGHPILVIDDNPADVRLIREALESGAPPAHAIHVAEDGAAAIEILGTLHPALILLDLRLPGMNGYEILAQIRSQHRLAAVPVVVFSSSDSQEDILCAYSASANCYVTKPAGLDCFLDTVRRIRSFWLPR
jgi:two-component system response regulator